MPRKPMPEAERFWRHVEIKGPDDCWPWQAYRVPRGFGIFNFRGKRTTALRIAMILAGIDVPDDVNARHSCDNPPCCNPLHGFVGTQKDNIASVIVGGERHGRCVVTDAQVAEMRHRYATTDASQMTLAKEYGLGRGHVRRILRGKARPRGRKESQAFQ